MTLPRVYALYDYWQEEPPAHVVMKLAWLKDKEDSKESTQEPAPSEDNTESNIHSFMGMPDVKGFWHGPPAFRPEDVERLAKEAANGRS